MKCGSLPSRWTFIIFFSAQLTAIISLDILHQTNERMSSTHTERERKKNKPIHLKRRKRKIACAGWDIWWIEKKTSREKRNASDDMQKEKGCCCFCYWRVRATSSCAVQITACSNHILCNFLIFCIFFVICVKFRVISWRGQISRLTANLSLNSSWEENKRYGISHDVQNRTQNIRNRLIGALKENTHTSNNG